MRKLTTKELDQLGEVAVKSAQKFIFNQVSKKEVLDLDIQVELDQSDILNVDIKVDIILDSLSSTDEKIADQAADHALSELEKLLQQLK